MRRLAALLALLSLPALAQPEVFFGDGRPPVFKEHETDRRFTRSRLNQLLVSGPRDDACLQLTGAMLTVLAELGPSIHERDENFTVDPALLQAFQAQVATPAFPAVAYLQTMVRRVMIDRKLPAAWLETAERINPTVRIIDTAKLRFLSDGVRPIDSLYFTLEALKARYELEVNRATTATRDTALLAFRDAYLDRDVAWGNFQLVDLGPAKRKKKKKGEEPDDATWATLELIVPRTSDSELQLFKPKEKTKPIRVRARLAEDQYVDLHRYPKGKRVLVRGRLWEFNLDLTELELRDALVFEDRDWSAGATLASPEVIARCPAAVNELQGLSPVHPGGFGQRR